MPANSADTCTRAALLITLGAMAAGGAHAQNAPASPAPQASSPAPPVAATAPGRRPTGLRSQPPVQGAMRWPGPIDGNRAPVVVLDVGAKLFACSAGTVEVSGVSISALRYELTEACRDARPRGHIEVSGIAGQPPATQPKQKTPDAKPRAERHPPDSVHDDAGPRRPVTRCDPATWNCRPEQH